MGLKLGIDGKTRALEVNAGKSITNITTIYVGLLQAAPANMDGMSLATLISSGQGNEFSVDPSFYTGRQAITIGSTTADADGAYANNSGSVIEWTNTTGYDVEVAGFFITTVSTGSSGLVLWVGTPDAGTSTIPNTQKASISVGDLLLKVD